ncbi:50S ribosomal protein L20 [Rhabdochlamydiaceae symbiont of Dictyostelium giganteum]|uniref:50S ribosomal protein L20 n=1 Tax=Rhabdochlamydiaceae symbiont of Dictyostelium giganteum TaxID=3342349 RepID=UPI0038506232
MVRATNAVYSNRKRKRLLKQAKGFVGDRKNHRRLTSNSVLQAMAYNYQGRKLRKRDFRSLWINRLSVGANLHGLSYSKFIDGLNKASCLLNRKMLTEMAIADPAGFAAVASCVKLALV